MPTSSFTKKIVIEKEYSTNLERVLSKETPKLSENKIMKNVELSKKQMNNIFSKLNK